MTDQYELPRGWAWATLGDLGPIISGGTPSTSDPENFDGHIPWITPADLTGYTKKTIDRGRRNLSEKGLRSSSARLIPRRSVLFSSRAPIGYVAIAANDVTTNQGFKSIAVSEEIDESFVYYYLKSARRLAEARASGTTFKEISAARFAQLPIPVAPLAEQCRIVEKIETLFAELDKGEEYLRQVQTLLTRYRQSVLKAAVTGELTADWRAQRAGQLEHGRDLLARILKARREKWQGRGRYVEPAEPDTRNLPKLPDGWVWSSLGQLIVTIEAGKNVRCEERPPRAAEVGIVKVSAVTWGEFDELQSKTITDPSYVSPSLRIQEGDLLISRANTLELVGASVVVGPVQRHLQLSDKVLRLRCAYPLEHWLNITLRSALGRAQIQAFATGAQLSMRNISQENMQRIAVPLPPPEEINLLVAKTALLQAQEKEMLSVVLDTMKRSGVLRQTILKDAFSGRLVPQDPNDEPAAELLARIRAQRAMESRKTARRMATA